MQRIRVLLDSNDEAYDGALRLRSTPSGFAEERERRYTCGSCGGDGCARCEGGRVTVVERDAYDTGLNYFDPGAQERRLEAARRDAAIARLRELELVRAGVLATGVDFESELKRAEQRDSRGDYRRLRAYLDVLPRHLSRDDAIQWLAEHIPGPIKVPRWAYEREQEELELQVRELADAGLIISEIAEGLAISQRQVKRALRATAKR